MSETMFRLDPDWLNQMRRNDSADDLLQRISDARARGRDSVYTDDDPLVLARLTALGYAVEPCNDGPRGGGAHVSTRPILG